MHTLACTGNEDES
uniref:Uncharacterized protein n=1 Tax=Arundo donax TaxID=35708 RepID=A0A0A9GH23_ARUDO